MSGPLLSARATLAPRALDSGAIAGAVIGSVVGALFILFCLFPFFVRARRAWRSRRHGDAAHEAEMGQSQSPGGRSSTPKLAHTDESKSLSGDLLAPAQGERRAPNGHIPTTTTTDSVMGNGHGFHDQHKAASLPPHQPHSSSPPPPGVSIQQGLPSPISPPLSPTSRRGSSPFQAPDQGQAYPSPPADEHAARPSARSIPHESSGTAGRQSTRELSLTDSHSYGPPSRELTSFTAAGITEEPDSLENQPHRRFSRVSGSIRSLLHKHSLRRDSRRSTAAGTDGQRSPSLVTEVLPQPEPSQLSHQSTFDVEHIDPRGAAWEYYNGSDLGYSDPSGQLQTSYTSAAAPLSVVPPAHAQAPQSQIGQPFISADGVLQHMVAEPDTISPESDQTITPKDPSRTFSRQASLLKNLNYPGPLQRTDSLPPPTIVSDIGAQPFNFNTPSGNPMELFKPTNEAESNWMIKQEILKIDSPPPPAGPSTAFMPPLPEETYIKAENPEPEYQLHSGPGYPQQQGIGLDANQGYIDLTGMGVGVDYSQVFVDVSSVNFNSVDQAQFNNVANQDQYVNATNPNQFAGASQQNQYENALGQHQYSSAGKQNLYDNINIDTTQFVPGNQNIYNNLESNANHQNYDNTMDPNQYDNGLLSDFSTPPPFSDPSAENTPDTRNTAYTASPSPRSDIIDPRVVGHLGASPRTFPCDQCHREFDQIHKLNHHKRYHDRPHECPHTGCTMRFGTKTHLDRHINDKHNKTRKFYCTQHDCPYSRQGGKSFPRKDNWRRHMLNKHRITPESDPVEYMDDTMIGT